MIKRLFRAIRSWFGRLISSAEDPRTVLEQNIRDLNDQVPKMNESIASAKGNLKVLENDLENARDRAAEQERKIKIAIGKDREDIARKHTRRLEDAEAEIDRLETEVAQARKVVKKAQTAKDKFMKERKEKIRKAKKALRQHEQAKWQSEIADAMEQFETAGIDQTHDEMLNRVEQETAKSRAELEMALDSVDDDELDLDEDAEELRAQEIVDSFKKEMDETKAIPEKTSAEDSPVVENTETKEKMSS